MELWIKISDFHSSSILMWLLLVGLLHHIDVGCIANISDILTLSIFMHPEHHHGAITQKQEPH
jgi:hypothetical protein